MHISLRSLNSARNDSLWRNERIPAELFAFASSPVLGGFQIVIDGSIVLTYQVKKNGNKAALLVHVDNQNESYLFHACAVMANDVIKKYHPACMILQCTSANLRKALSENLFFQKGRCMQRMVEPWRSLTDDRCFDQEGYLINQGLMKDLPFGWTNTVEHGCGWIAAYNLLKLMHAEKTMQETAEGLGRHAWMGEVFGQEIFTLFHWLKQQGLHVKLEIGGEKRSIACMNQSDYGILLYTHAQASHYTTYARTDDKRFHFYNAVYGSTNLVLSAEQFMKQYSKRWKTMVIAVEKQSLQ